MRGEHQVPLRIQVKETQDQRGSFIKVWESDKDTSFQITQIAFSINPNPFTLRGLHYQEEPDSEEKLIYVLKGRIFDVMVDLRRNSNTYLQIHEYELGAGSSAILIPKGFAHGFLTLEIDTVVSYNMSHEYCVESARGIRWDDPALQIAWPVKPAIISERDSQFPLL